MCLSIHTCLFMHSFISRDCGHTHRMTRTLLIMKWNTTFLNLKLILWQLCVCGYKGIFDSIECN